MGTWKRSSLRIDADGPARDVQHGGGENAVRGQISDGQKFPVGSPAHGRRLPEPAGRPEQPPVTGRDIDERDARSPNVGRGAQYGESLAVRGEGRLEEVIRGER